MNSEAKSQQFPRYVFKRGTGKAENHNGLFTAESVLVHSEAQMAGLGEGWCDSPVDAAATPTKANPPHASPEEADDDSKRHKKVK